VATRDEIIAAILKTAGDPSVGAIKELAPAMADEILALDEPVIRSSKSVETRETR
jgi:hypothetical protein